MPVAQTMSNPLRRVERRLVEWWASTSNKALVGILFGLVLAASGFAYGITEASVVRTLRDRGVETDAVVVDVDDTITRTGTQADRVVVRFTPDGRTPIEATVANRATLPREVEAGESVRVVFDPERPALVLLEAQMNDGHIVWSFIVGATGVVVLAISSLVWLVTRRRRTAD